jgi:hypothetical protein
LPLAPIISLFLFSKLDSFDDTSFHVNILAHVNSTCTSFSLATSTNLLSSFVK